MRYKQFYKSAGGEMMNWFTEDCFVQMHLCPHWKVLLIGKEASAPQSLVVMMRMTIKCHFFWYIFNRRRATKQKVEPFKLITYCSGGYTQERRRRMTFSEFLTCRIVIISFLQREAASQWMHRKMGREFQDAVVDEYRRENIRIALRPRASSW